MPSRGIFCRNVGAPRPGFTLLETAISSLLVGVVLVASMKVLGQSLVTQRERAQLGTGTFLAEGLLSEILQQAYMEPGLLTSAIGREADETATNRSNYDDVDDYHGYTESPPTDKSNQELVGFNGWRRSVVVQWVAPADLAATRLTESGVKRVTVQAFYHERLVTTAIGFRGNAP